MRIHSLANICCSRGATWPIQQMDNGSSPYVDGSTVDIVSYSSYYTATDLCYGKGVVRSIAALSGCNRYINYDVRDHWSTNN